MSNPTEALLAEHEPVIGVTSLGGAIVGCSCLSARDYRAAGYEAGQAGYRAHLAAVLAPRLLPDPEGGCVCTMHDSNYPIEPPDGEYEPACPVHSTHLYDPRSGTWVTHSDEARRFTDWVATNAAYNGASDTGQRFYDWGLNAWLPQQIATYGWDT